MGGRLVRIAVTTTKPRGVAPTWIRKSRVSPLAPRASLETVMGLAAVILPLAGACSSKTH
jgi:hypothetical protein